MKRKIFVLTISAVVVGVLVWLAFRALWRMTMLGYEDSAIVRVRAVVAAEGEFAKTHPDKGYTCTLSQLTQSELVERLTNAGIDNGYSFNITGCEDIVPEKSISTYHVTARPLHSGLPAFCSDPSGVVKSDAAGSIDRCLAIGVPLGR